jgi:hypothetical protein
MAVGSSWSEAMVTLLMEDVTGKLMIEDTDAIFTYVQVNLGNK